MSFYKELVPFIDYIHSIRRLETYLSFDMKFPTKWSLPKSIVEEGQVVGFETDNQNLKGISFVSQMNEKEISTILVKIGKVIKLNKEKELKERLFKQTVEQLKQTFEKTDLDKLQSLYFDFESAEINPELDINEDLIDDEIEDEQDGQGPTTTELVQ
jgi:penicillin-binding protein-related factor A (putative recombinase)